MKKIFAVTAGTFLFIMFLYYAGVFRDDTDPVEVAKYYYESMRNFEYVLTYQIFKKDKFNNLKDIDDHKKYKLYLIDKIEFKLLNIISNTAYVQSVLIYKDNKTIKSIVTLEKEENQNWLIKDVQYDEAE